MMSVQRGPRCAGTVMRKKKRLPYRHENGFSLIEIRLHKLQQLFSSLDPSPFRDRDLDPAAESYIVYAVKDFPLSRPMKVVLFLPETELALPDIPSLPEAVHNYFAYREAVTMADLKSLLHGGWMTFVIALLFLMSCLMLRQMVDGTLSDTRSEVIKEGLLIMGWVAMWRPINTFLYDWWPLVGRIRVFSKLKHIAVEIRTQ